MVSKSVWNTVFQGLLALAVLMLPDANLSQAADLPTSPGVGFASVAVVSGQTARLNAQSVGPGACGGGVAFEFYSVEGELLKRIAIPNLQPGKTAFLDLKHEELPKGAARTEVRAVLRFGWDKGFAPNAAALRVYECNIVPSLEVFDSVSGRTTLVLTDAKSLPAPNPPRK